MIQTPRPAGLLPAMEHGTRENGSVRQKVQYLSVTWEDIVKVLQDEEGLDDREIYQRIRTEIQNLPELPDDEKDLPDDFNLELTLLSCEGIIEHGKSYHGLISPDLNFLNPNMRYITTEQFEQIITGELEP